MKVENKVRPVVNERLEGRLHKIIICPSLFHGLRNSVDCLRQARALVIKQKICFFFIMANILIVKKNKNKTQKKNKQAKETKTNEENLLTTTIDLLKRILYFWQYHLFTLCSNCVDLLIVLVFNF